jgi:hypothetical protein
MSPEWVIENNKRANIDMVCALLGARDGADHLPHGPKIHRSTTKLLFVLEAGTTKWEDSVS